MSNEIPVGKRLEAALEQYEKENKMSEKRRIYIAGPMTGLPNYNHDVFNNTAKRLRAEGWTVINPVEVCAEFGTVEELEKDGTLLGRAMREELELLAACDAIHLLYGWQNSKGARKELAVALEHGLKIMFDKSELFYRKDVSAFALNMFNEFENAEAKHPHDKLKNVDTWNDTREYNLGVIKDDNDIKEGNGCFWWYGILYEEVLESIEAICKGDFKAARAELAQVACVALRAWIWCCEKMKK